jgi:23S rRNA (uracil1939-C5)-methyltransferase
MKAGDIFEAKILSLGYGGQAVSKKQGIVFFIDRGVPGDIAQLRVKKIKKNYASAELIKILNPAQSRINPKCAAYARGCGGCQWLQVNYPDQLYWKTKILRDALKHIGKINKEVLPIIGMRSPVRYRNKVSTHRNSQGKIGLMKFNSHEIICFQECSQILRSNEVLCQVINELCVPQEITQVHLRSTTRGETGVCLYAGHNDKEFANFAQRLKQNAKNIKGVGLSLPSQFLSLSGDPYLCEEINSLTYYFPLNGFMQTNFVQAAILQQLVLKYLASGQKGIMLDLYCGSGFFTLALAGRAGQVYGIENNLQSIESARLNARINKITNVCFICKEVGNFLNDFKERDIRILLLDPPRTGCSKQVLSQIIKLKPQKIIYVSCAPDTLARDLSVLINSGYNIEACQPIDMFPHTYHMEIVVSLVLPGS